MVSLKGSIPRYYDRDILKPTRDGGNAACRLLIDRYARSGEIGRIWFLLLEHRISTYEGRWGATCSGYRNDARAASRNWGAGMNRFYIARDPTVRSVSVFHGNNLARKPAFAISRVDDIEDHLFELTVDQASKTMRTTSCAVSKT